MKNKIIVMFLTLIVMIFATPIVFEKLMNSKFNTMLLKTQQQKGIIIKEIKNKSSYLTTDRIFEVTIPGSAINQKEIKYIKLISEVRFKNLPITEVFFHNIVKKIVLVNNQELKFLENNFIFNVITPDFKHYNYVVENRSVDYNGTTIEWKNFKGIYVYPKEFKNEDGILTFLLKKQHFKISLQHIFSEFLKLNNKIEESSKLQHFIIRAPKLMITADDINSKDIKIDKKNKLDMISQLKVKSVGVNGVFRMDNSILSVNLINLDKKAFEFNESEEKRLQELLNNGFRGDIEFKVKHIYFMQPLGFLNIDINFTVNKGDNFKKLEENNLSFLNLNAKIVTSSKIGNLIKIAYPQLASMIEIKNNKTFVVIKIIKGKIYINGKEIKSY